MGSLYSLSGRRPRGAGKTVKPGGRLRVAAGKRTRNARSEPFAAVTQPIERTMSLGETRFHTVREMTFAAVAVGTGRDGEIGV